MKRTGIVCCALALLAISCSRAPKSCQACQREECRGLAFRVTLDNGNSVETCCPRCGLHYLQTSGKKMKSLSASDYATGKWLDATKAVYVSGSDVSPCATKEIRRDAQGCCYVKGYDRCLPSLIAFGGRGAAKEFQSKHGGELTEFSQLSE